MTKLPTQLFVGDEPTEDKVLRIKNKMHIKPTGGIWTSTFRKRGCGSDWIRWMYQESYFHKGHTTMWILTPKDVNVYTIDTYEDYLYLFERYGIRNNIWRLDWEKVAKDYDAVHVTYHGQTVTRLSRGHDDIDLYGWDVESTIWFRWCFEKVEKYGYTIEEYKPKDVWNDYKWADDDEIEEFKMLMEMIL